MSAELSLGSNAIQDLASQINDAISGVMNVEQILADTADDVQKAGDLKSRAEQVWLLFIITPILATGFTNDMAPPHPTPCKSP